MTYLVSKCFIESYKQCGAGCGAEMGNLTDLKAKNIKPGDKAVADGTVTGLRLEPGGTKGHGKWMVRFVSPETGKGRDPAI